MAEFWEHFSTRALELIILIIRALITRMESSPVVPRRKSLSEVRGVNLSNFGSGGSFVILPHMTVVIHLFMYLPVTRTYNTLTYMYIHCRTHTYIHTYGRTLYINGIHACSSHVWMFLLLIANIVKNPSAGCLQ